MDLTVDKKWLNKVMEDITLPIDAETAGERLDAIDGGAYSDDYYESFDKALQEDVVTDEPKWYVQYHDEIDPRNGIIVGYDAFYDAVDAAENEGEIKSICPEPVDIDIPYWSEENGLVEEVLDTEPKTAETVEEAVKMMEEAEDMVECAECFELSEKAKCKQRKDGRYVCETCCEAGLLDEDIAPTNNNTNNQPQNGSNSNQPQNQQGQAEAHPGQPENGSNSNQPQNNNQANNQPQNNQPQNNNQQQNNNQVTSEALDEDASKLAKDIVADYEISGREPNVDQNASHLVKNLQADLEISNSKPKTEAYEAEAAKYAVPGFNAVVLDSFEEDGKKAYNVLYSAEDYGDLCEVELWEDPSEKVWITRNIYKPGFLNRSYNNFDEFKKDLQYNFDLISADKNIPEAVEGPFDVEFPEPEDIKVED